MIEGIGGVRDLPSDLSIAIDQALRISAWLEHLAKDEMPDEWMWTLDWELEDHFKAVEAIRESKYNGGGEDTDDIEGSTMGNKLTENFRT